MSDITQGNAGQAPDKTWEQLPEDHPLVKALSDERKQNREARSELRLLRLQGKYPELGLTGADFEGVDPNRWESLADRLASRISGRAAEDQAITQPRTQEVVRQDAAISGLSNFGPHGRLLEGTSVDPNAGKKLGRDEAMHLYKTDRSKYDALDAAGMIDLGIRQVETAGGGIAFEPA